jgi:DNA repair protein RadC
MPAEERPRERLWAYGAGAVSTAELIAIQLRTGTPEVSALGLAERLLSRYSGVRGLANATVEEISREKGIGSVKAIQIAAAFELGKRLAALSLEDRPTISSPQDVANLLMPEIRDAKQEHFKALLLDAKNRLIKVVTISKGSLDESIAHPRDVFREAIAGNACSLIVAHNHPSGDPTPSQADKTVTLRLAQGGALLGIDLLDHIIIGDNRFVSLKERGVL